MRQQFYDFVHRILPRDARRAAELLPIVMSDRAPAYAAMRWEELAAKTFEGGKEDCPTAIAGKLGEWQLVPLGPLHSEVTRCLDGVRKGPPAPKVARPR